MSPRVRRLFGLAAIAIVMVAAVRRLVAVDSPGSGVGASAPTPSLEEPRSDSIGGWWTVALIAAAIAVLPAVGTVQAYKAHQMTQVRARLLTGGDPVAGKAAIARFACGSCHEIPGVAGANGMVGPPLKGVGERVYLAGFLRNSPANLHAWISRPQELKPGDAMPDAGLTDQQARDISAYLYTAR
jgi:cytochrome c1